METGNEIQRIKSGMTPKAMATPSKILFIVLFVLTACTSAGGVPAAPATATASARPTPTEIKVLPTPSSPGKPVVWRNLQVSMDQVEISDTFVTEFGTQRKPPAAKKFLWVHVTLKNVGEGQLPLPASENFSVLYAEAELKPIYGHRQGYADYSSLGSALFPDQELAAWLRFDIPDAAELNDLWFVFLPTSFQVGVSPSSPGYPYTETKPTFVWRCGP